MKKVWNIEGYGNDYVSDVYKKIREYSDGLNKSQEYIKSDISININYDSNVEIKLFVITPRCEIFKVEVESSGDLNLCLSGLRNIKRHSLIKPDELYQILDETIASDEMGSVIGHLIEVSKHNLEGTRI